MNWHETKFTRLESGEIDCRECKHHGYDCIGIEEYEICDKDHEIYPKECNDFTTFKFKYIHEID